MSAPDSPQELDEATREAIRRLVDQAPPLSATQQAYLRRVLRPGPVAERPASAA